ncbi:hypothetical protein KKC59_02865, partial [bacterium]|nr:hypothetical protein [bacterium]
MFRFKPKSLGVELRIFIGLMMSFVTIHYVLSLFAPANKLLHFIFFLMYILFLGLVMMYMHFRFVTPLRKLVNYMMVFKGVDVKVHIEGGEHELFILDTML